LRYPEVAPTRLRGEMKISVVSQAVQSGQVFALRERDGSVDLVQWIARPDQFLEWLQIHRDGQKDEGTLQIFRRVVVNAVDPDHAAHNVFGDQLHGTAGKCGACRNQAAAHAQQIESLNSGLSWTSLVPLGFGARRFDTIFRSTDLCSKAMRASLKRWRGHSRSVFRSCERI